MSYDKPDIVYTGHFGGVVMACEETGKCVILCDEDATGEQAEATIKWARGVLAAGNLKPIQDYIRRDGVLAK